MQTWGYNEGKSKAAENTNKDRNVRVAVKKTPEARDAKQDQNNRQDNEARMVDGRDPGKSWNNRSSSKWNNRTKPSDGGNKGVNLQKDRLSGETGRGKINQNNKNQDRLNMDNNTVKNREPGAQNKTNDQTGKTGNKGRYGWGVRDNQTGGDSFKNTGYKSGRNTVNSRDNRDSKDNRDNRDYKDNRDSRDSRDNRYRRDDRQRPAQSFSRNISRIKIEETLDDVKADIARIEKEIRLEIEEIKSMRLGL